MRGIDFMRSDYEWLVNTTTTLLIGCLLALEDPHFLDTWLRYFDARTKKLKDNKVRRRENKVTDLFVAHPLKWEDLILGGINQIKLRNMQPKRGLVMTEQDENFVIMRHRKTLVHGQIPEILGISFLKNTTLNMCFTIKLLLSDTDYFRSSWRKSTNI